MKLFKKISVLLSFLIIAFTSNAQFPLSQSIGNKNTQVFTQGALGSDSGYVYRYAFFDTASANIGYLKNVAGLTIRTVDDIIWVRNSTATKWLPIGKALTFMNGVFLNKDTVRIGGSLVDSVLISGNGRKFILDSTSLFLKGLDKTGISFYTGLLNDPDYYIKRAGTTLYINSPGTFALRNGAQNVYLYVPADGHTWRNTSGIQLSRISPDGDMIIGTPPEPVPSAILELSSVSKGFKPPVMTAVQRIAITSPAIGLQVFDTDTSSMFQYTASGWQNMRGAGGGGGSSIKAANGLTLANDTVRLGGTLSDSITHLQLEVGSKTDQNTIAPSKVYVLSNRTLAQDQSSSDWVYWQQRGANALQWYQRMFFESDNDTAAQQYNGMINGLNRFVLDKDSPRYDSASGKTVNMQYAGVYMVNQLYPAKNVVVSPSPFGADGSVFTGALGFGRDSAYTITLSKNLATPMPLTAFHSEIDFNRAVPSNKSRVFRGGGVGIGGYTSFWKSHQQSQGSADSTNPSYISLTYGFKDIGSIYANPFNGMVKERILRRSSVDTSVSFWAAPQYTDSNETINGFAFWNEGVRDWNYFAGRSRFGGAMPNRQSIDTIAHTAEYFGNVLMEGSNNLRFRAPSTGTFPGMYWAIKDSAGPQGNIDFNMTSSRDTRGLIIGVGTSSTATSGYPSQSGSGFYIDFRTGLNGAFTTRMFRNGNTVFGTQANVYNYMDFAKVSVVGKFMVVDSVKFRRVPLITSGSGYDVVVRSRADSVLYAIPYDSLPSAGGGALFGRTDVENNTGAGLAFNNKQEDFTIDSVNNFSVNSIEDGDVKSSTFVNNQNANFVTSDNSGASLVQNIVGTANSAAYMSTSKLGNGARMFQTTVDSLYIRYPNTFRSADTTTYKLIARDKNTGALIDAYWPVSGGGGGSPAGSSTQVQFNSSGSFGASSGFTYDGTAVTINSGSDVNSPNAFILGTGASRRATLGVGASNHFYLQNTHASDANAGIVLRNRTGANMGTFSTGGSTLNTSIRYPTTQVSANYSISVSSDYIIEVTANTPTLTLPTATSQNGLTYKIVNTGAGTAVIQTTSSQVIGNSGSATSINLTAGSALEITAINGAWRIF